MVMKLFEGKSPTERNKIIAATVLGVLAVVSLFFAFGRGVFSGGSSTNMTVKVSPTPKQPANPGSNADNFKLPTAQEQLSEYQSIPVVYNPAVHAAPDPGRNIFAFYEPPLPCPTCPTPVPPPVASKTPEPTPTPDFMLAYAMPQSVYSGSRGFRLEVNGDKFTEDSRIYFNQRELRTSFISQQKLVADVSAEMINGAGDRQVIVQTPDGRKHSNQLMFQVQEPPKPQFQYIGMIARMRYNNDTAYFQEQGQQTPISARLNDVVGGRFRLLSISSEETVFEDVNLGFRHKVALYRPPPGTVISNAPTTNRRGFPQSEQYIPYNPNMPNVQSIPGVPDNIPRVRPPRPNRIRDANSNTNNPPRDDDEDNDDGDTDDDGGDGKP